MQTFPLYNELQASLYKKEQNKVERQDRRNNEKIRAASRRRKSWPKGKIASKLRKHEFF